MKPTIVFRADASASIGHGHVVRCLALADAFRNRGYSCLFVVRPDGAALVDDVIARGHSLATLPELPEHVQADAEATLDMIDSSSMIAAVVVDHYGLDISWEKYIRGAGLPVMAIDDMPRAHACDYLLDQNIIDGDNPYLNQAAGACHYFLGPQYALLRREFSELRDQAVVRSDLQRILIFFGGSDPENETSKALKGLLSLDRDWAMDVVIGATNPHREELQRLCLQHAERVNLHVQTSHMAELMVQADLAVGAAGSASWERCCLRLPSLVSILADNQMAVAFGLERAGAAVNMGWSKDISVDGYAHAVAQLENFHLCALSEAAGRLVDGLGGMRLAMELESFLGSKQ
jgi:UDP-2,4-diacetamido-2,4,6-trideoxy-beta-L-altropyranose hydrolase